MADNPAGEDVNVQPVYRHAPVCFQFPSMVPVSVSLAGPITSLRPGHSAFLIWTSSKLPKSCVFYSNLGTTPLCLRFANHRVTATRYGLDIFIIRINSMNKERSRRVTIIGLGYLAQGGWKVRRIHRQIVRIYLYHRVCLVI